MLHFIFLSFSWHLSRFNNIEEYTTCRVLHNPRLQRNILCTTSQRLFFFVTTYQRLKLLNISMLEIIIKIFSFSIYLNYQLASYLKFNWTHLTRVLALRFVSFLFSQWFRWKGANKKTVCTTNKLVKRPEKRLCEWVNHSWSSPEHDMVKT